ncbi:MAG: threonylcarbamoyl-AMP synthase [Spirochaetaceae bacterium]|jgi:L-threonylcarbamoyladenylate synthase|nr:threonylcarbamoyl-AMP synthase [Spirochaetaceae bacterium]
MLYLELNEQNILTAAKMLSSGKLVAFPTETVYGLGCDAFNTAALARVFEAKKRPRFDPLIIHIASHDTLERLVDFGRLSEDGRQRLAVLARALWPGPLTLVLPKLKTVPDLATAGLGTAAVRFPAHAGALRLITESTGAVAAPSANPFGYLSPTRAEHVRSQLGGAVDAILDGGPADIGVESTVLDVEARRILRPGGVSREAIEVLTGPLADPQTAFDSGTDGAAAPSPGLLKNHYAPRKELHLHTAEAMRRLSFSAGSAYLFFDRPSFKAFAEHNGLSRAVRANIFILSERGSLNEAAARLFDTLHRIDASPAVSIHAALVPEAGIGAAINDRLSRASTRPYGFSQGIAVNLRDGAAALQRQF